MGHANAVLRYRRGQVGGVIVFDGVQGRRFSEDETDFYTEIARALKRTARAPKGSCSRGIRSSTRQYPSAVLQGD